jgi:hypothetical protein
VLRTVSLYLPHAAATPIDISQQTTNWRDGAVALHFVAHQLIGGGRGLACSLIYINTMLNLLRGSQRIGLREQFRQFSNVFRDPLRFFAAELPHRQLPARLIFEMDMRKGPVVFVMDDETRWQRLNRPRLRKSPTKSGTHSSHHSTELSRVLCHQSGRL